MTTSHSTITAVSMPADGHPRLTLAAGEFAEPPPAVPSAPEAPTRIDAASLPLRRLAAGECGPW